MLMMKSSTFESKPLANYRHLLHIELEDQLIQKFIEETKSIHVQRLEYVPFVRMVAADIFKSIFGSEFVQVIRETLHDRNYGGFTIGLQGQSEDKGDYLKFATAISHLVGIPNFDSMTNNYYASFHVKHVYDSDTYLRQPYRTLEFHTDGTFVNEKTDWLIMMKWEERNAVGGESRILHLDDWNEMEKYSKHPLATQKLKFSYAHKQSKNTSDVVYAPVFYERNNKTCMRFNDQASFPETVEQGVYLNDISESMENSSGVQTLVLPVGSLIMLNNHFWLHGREAFEENENLYRELMRQRGYFA